MDTTEPEYSFTDYPINNDDGSRNSLSVCTPVSSLSDTPLVFIYPAMGVPAKYYCPLLESFAKQGFIAACCDLRGLGHSSVRASKATNFSYRHHIEIDLPVIIATLKNRYPDNPLFLLGHSLGGQMEALYLSANPDAAHGLILAACCSVYYKGWSGAQRYMLCTATQFYRSAAVTLGYFPGKKLGFGGTEAKGVMQDWGRQALSGRYDLADTEHDYEMLLASQPKPVLGISFTTDIFAPRAAVQNLLDKLKAAKVEHWHLSGDEIAVPKVNHMTWVKKPDGLTPKIADWIRQQL